jgi:hypothetical protein
MSKYVPIRFNDAEEAFLQRSFAASDDEALGTHIKRVYFDALRPNTDALQSMRTELERINSEIGRLQGAEARAADPQLLLSVLCGLYVMVRKSVGESIRSQADQVLDVAAIESYLKGR